MKAYNFSSIGNRVAKQWTFVLAILISSPVWSQIEFSMGLEAGVHSSGIPTRNEWSTGRGSAINRDLPLIRALGGAWGKMKFTKHFYVSIGVQYTTIGSRFTQDEQGYYNVDDVNFTSQVREDYTFDKLSYPMMLGYDFRIKKLPFSVFMGYRPANLTNGKYYYKATYSDESGLYDYADEKHIDPFDDASLAIEAHRHLKQFLIGAGVAVKNNFYISFLCANGERIAFFEATPPGSWEFTGNEHYYERWDLVLSLKYTLLRSGTNKPQ
jgi:hypothetical protein